MGNNRRRFTAEFKAEAVELSHSSPDKTIEQVASELGIAATSLYRWRELARKTKPSKAKAITDSEEVRQLKRELQRVRMERDILKKAVAHSTGERDKLRTPWLKGDRDGRDEKKGTIAARAGGALETLA